MQPQSLGRLGVKNRPANTKRNNTSSKNGKQTKHVISTTRNVTNVYRDAVRVRGTTDLGTLVCAAEAGTVLRDELLGPSQWPNTMLASRARTWEKYTLKSAVIHYTPVIASTINCSLLTYHEKDPTDTAKPSHAVERALAHQGCKEFSANSAARINVTGSGDLFTSAADDTPATLRQSYFGRFVVVQRTPVVAYDGTTIPAGMTLGALKLEWDIEFKHAQFEPEDDPTPPPPEEDDPVTADVLAVTESQSGGVTAVKYLEISPDSNGKLELACNYTDMQLEPIDAADLDANIYYKMKTGGDEDPVWECNADIGNGAEANTYSIHAVDTGLDLQSTDGTAVTLSSEFSAAAQANLSALTGTLTGWFGDLVATYWDDSVVNITPQPVTRQQVRPGLRARTARKVGHCRPAGITVPRIRVSAV